MAREFNPLGTSVVFDILGLLECRWYFVHSGNINDDWENYLSWFYESTLERLKDLASKTNPPYPLWNVGGMTYNGVYHLYINLNLNDVDDPLEVVEKRISEYARDFADKFEFAPEFSEIPMIERGLLFANGKLFAEIGADVSNTFKLYIRYNEDKTMEYIQNEFNR